MEEETEKKDISKMLETLTTKIEELTKVVKKEKILTKEEIGETSKEEKLIERLADKIGDLTNVIKDKKMITEEKIKENPLAYVIGAFAGGLVVGFLFGKRKEGKE